MIVGTDLWKGLGWSAIIYLAAIAGIDTTLYEAAIIDGCSKLKRIWYITLPLLKGTFILQLILRAGSIMNAGFDQIYVIASDQVLSVAEILGVQGGNPAHELQPCQRRRSAEIRDWTGSGSGDE